MKNTIYYPAMLSVLLLASCGNADNKKADQRSDSLNRDTALVIDSGSKAQTPDTAELAFSKMQQLVG